jgi:hypothetical protein
MTGWWDNAWNAGLPGVSSNGTVSSGDIPYPAGQPVDPFAALRNVVGGAGSAAGAAGGGGADAAPWGVAPPLNGGMGPMGYANQAPPPLPTPGSWNSSMSSMTGAPLTPNNTGLPYPAIPPSTNGGDPNVAQWEAGNNLINSQSGLIGAKRTLEGMQPMKWNAAGQVLDARQHALGAQSSYLDEQARNNAASQSEQMAIMAAKNDTRNVVAVARAQRDQQNTDYRYKIAGLSAPIDVDMPDGFSGPLPPGVRARLETIADKLTRQSTNNEKIRKFHEEAARIATAKAGLEVTAADIASGRVSLSLEQAEQAVRLAGLDVDQAQLAAAATKVPPAPGLVWDDKGHQWVNATDLKDIQRLRENQSNEYAGFSISELISLLNGGKLDEGTFRSVLANPNGNYGYTDATVQHLLDLAEVQKAKTALSFDPSIFAVGNVPAPPSGPTTAGGSPLGAVGNSALNTIPH